MAQEFLYIIHNEHDVHYYKLSHELLTMM